MIESIGLTRQWLLIATSRTTSVRRPALCLVWSGLAWGRPFDYTLYSTCSDDFPGGRNVNVVVVVP
jgi:hypothetical protein